VLQRGFCRPRVKTKRMYIHCTFIAAPSTLLSAYGTQARVIHGLWIHYECSRRDDSWLRSQLFRGLAPDARSGAKQARGFLHDDTSYPRSNIISDWTYANTISTVSGGPHLSCPPPQCISCGLSRFSHSYTLSSHRNETASDQN
jgi:hypothetical protein